MYNPVTRVYGEPHKRPEVQNATIEFMAPSEYMVRFCLPTFLSLLPPDLSPQSYTMCSHNKHNLCRTIISQHFFFNHFCIATIESSISVETK